MLSLARCGPAIGKHHAGWASAFAEIAGKRQKIFEGNERFAGLGRAPVIEHAHLVHARDRAVGGTGFLGVILMIDMIAGVLSQRNGGESPLLGAVVDKAIFANVKVAASGAASPIRGHALGNVLLKAVHPRVGALTHLHNLGEKILLMLA